MGIWNRKAAGASRRDESGAKRRSSAAARPFMLQPLAPAVVVLAVLLALGLLSVRIEHEVTRVHGDITAISEPARRAVTNIQLSLALEAAGTRGYLLTGDTMFIARHRAAREQRRDGVRALERVASSSPPEVQKLVVQLSSQLRPADALLDSLFEGSIGEAEYLTRLPAQQRRFESVTASVRAIDGIIGEYTAGRVDQMESAQRNAMLVTLALVAVAAVAVVLVARLGLSYRELAERESRARGEAVRRRREAERLSASRSRLARGFTHDVKNPLGAAAGYLDLMAEGIMAPGDAARQARRALGQALDLIDELLQLERDRTGEIAIHRRRFDLRDSVTEAVEDWRAAAAAKGLTIETDLPAEFPAIDSDPQRVRQVLGNLISNAVRYTARGSVTVRLGLHPGRDREPREWATVTVRDTGPGLSGAQREQLFREFRRLDTAEGTKGSGLGLSISKRMAEAMGGRIAVESEPGTGSTFTLLLPCERVVADLEVERDAIDAIDAIDARSAVAPPAGAPPLDASPVSSPSRDPRGAGRETALPPDAQR